MAIKKDWIENSAAVALIAAIVWGFGCLVTGPDDNDWQALDGKGECYLRILEDRNAILTPDNGNNDSQTFYCKVDKLP